MRIIIDCDGVLADFVTVARGVAKDLLNKDVPHHDGEWDVLRNHLNKEEVSIILNYIANKPGMVRGLRKFDYADNLIEMLRCRGELVACTSVLCGKCFAGERIEWLKEELGFDRTDIILAHKKYLVTGDVFIDDKPDNVVRWAETFPKGMAVMWQSPGRPIDPGCIAHLSNAIHCNNVEDLLRKIDEKSALVAG